MSSFLSTDRVAGFILFLIGGWYTFEATTLKSPIPADTLGPGAFPLVLGIVLMFLSIFLIIRPDKNPIWPEISGWVKMALILLSFVIYAYIMEPLGYIVATSLEMIALSYIFKGPRVMSIIASVIFSMLMFILFSTILDLRLPTGDIFEGFLG